MIGRVLGVSVAVCLLTIFAYVSRFWVFEWWGREGLFGVEELRRGGDLWRRWMNDLGLGPFDILFWAVGVFVVLTIVQKIWDAATPDD